MKTVTINGETWFVSRVLPGSTFLIDRTGAPRLATADPAVRTIYVSSAVVPPMLDAVLLHEVAHAITISYGLLPYLHENIPEESKVPVEEWAVKLLENYSLEAIILTGQLLGRPVCIDSRCAIIYQDTQENE